MMAKGKMSKTNVAARRAQREQVTLCPVCGNPQEVAMVIAGRGKTQMVKLCCEKAGKQ
jgi:formate dehydrogenase maturation protein FdhE